MKVLLVTNFPPEIGGPATQASHLCRALLARGHIPVVLAFDPKRSSRREQDGVLVYRARLRPAGVTAKVFDYATFVRRFDRILRTERPDLVHCNSMGIFAFLAVLACRARSVPAVVKFASDLVWEVVNRDGLVAASIEESYGHDVRARAAAVIQSTTLRLATLIWATSRYRRDTLVRVAGVAPCRIRVIPNYIRLPDPPPQRRRSADGTVSLVTGGRFVPHKRLPDAILALARLERDDVELRIYGGGDDGREAAFGRLARELGVADRVRLLGRLDYQAMLELIASSDIYVSTSIEEGFPITLIEAMATGRPVVAARRGGVLELVPDGAAGILFEPGDVGSLVDALRRLIEDPSLRERLGREGASRAARFDMEQGIEEYCRLYREAIALHRGGSLRRKGLRSRPQRSPHSLEEER